MKIDAQLRVGVLKEALPGERRVSLTPADVKKLGNQIEVVVESGAGEEAGFSDAEYAGASAHVDSRAAVLSTCRLVTAVRPPDLAGFRSGQIVVSLGGRDGHVAEAATAAGVMHLGLERLPRISRAQSMDVLSSQASVAGYAAVLEGARLLSILLPMMTTAAGIVRPAKVIALGAGVAGLQVLATARRLGAVTFGFDVREAAREQVESLGATFVFPDVPVTAEGSGGYAASQSEAQQEVLRRALAPHLEPMNLIVASAQIPGQRAPLLIDDATIRSLRPGTVIIDLAAESGGNVVNCEPDGLIRSNGITVYGPTNLPSTVATDASRLFSGNIRALLEHLLHDSTLDLTRDDPIVAALVNGQALASPAPANHT